MPIPSQDLDFQRHMSWPFLWSASSVIKGDVIVDFVDIGGIHYYHCLKER